MSNSERFMICHNPDGATRDAHLREQSVAQLVELITGPDTLPAMKRGELRGKISTKPGRNPHLRVSPGGLVRIDNAKIKAEANRDGKYLLRCSDPHLPAADIARLEAAPRGRTRLRDMKQILDLRPVYHRSNNASAPTSCSAGLRCCSYASSRPPPARPGTTSAATSTGSAITFTGPTGTFRQRTDPTKAQIDLYARLDLPSPRRSSRSPPT